MIAHLRANLWLLGMTLLLCSVVYPLALLAVGKTAFPRQAAGSLVDEHLSESCLQPVGSHLIAQSFSGDEYFHPRPSAVSYHAAASGASNLGASNPLLRERVAWQLGGVVKYGRKSTKAGQRVGPDVEEWVRHNPGVIARWAMEYPGSAERWFQAEPGHANLVARWKAETGMSGEATAADVIPFFQSHAGRPASAWPEELRQQIQAGFFDLWRQAHPDEDLEPVPADMVMTSGSGLDPHITLPNAMYQLDRVAAAWASKTGMDEAGARKEIEALLREKAAAPLAGWVGMPMINVLEVNLALPGRVRPDGPASLR